jgi:hypothetical protein
MIADRTLVFSQQKTGRRTAWTRRSGPPGRARRAERRLIAAVTVAAVVWSSVMIVLLELLVAKAAES